ncbi:hypothetical protein [Rubritalea tangerina]|uniref:hypothetical protein n=1 Tax=Rubritalea tangerina TaxID=430798 RepID=UPI003610AE07
MRKYGSTLVNSLFDCSLTLPPPHTCYCANLRQLSCEFTTQKSTEAPLSTPQCFYFHEPFSLKPLLNLDYLQLC